jgi:tRNA modification GTPase
MVDSALGWYLPGPGSFTGEDTVELCCHGSPVVLNAVVEAAVGFGARMAVGGEFTQRAFLNGRIDLAQAESVVSLVRAGSLSEAAAAAGGLSGGVGALAGELREALVGVCARLEAGLDFPEEAAVAGALAGVVEQVVDVEERAQRALAAGGGTGLVGGRWVVALVGAVNAGKSTLFNRLLGEELAIVDAAPGTTRDVVRGRWRVGGRWVELVDTAGLRPTGDRVEKEGIRRALATAGRAAVVVVVVDGTRGWGAAEEEAWEAAGDRGIVVVNKMDVAGVGVALGSKVGERALKLSGLTGEGVGRLRAAIAERVSGEVWEGGVVLAAERQRQEMGAVVECVGRARAVLAGGGLVEVAAVELRGALRGLERLLGRGVDDEVLAAVFRDFCVGK